MAFYSSGVEYGIHSLMCMVDSKGDAREMSVRKIADLQSVPYDYLAKIFTRLSKAGLVRSIEGKGGGFQLAKPAEHITVLDVVNAIDGDKRIFECREIRQRLAVFDAQPPAWTCEGICGVRSVMDMAQQRMEEALEQHTILDLARKMYRKAPDTFVVEVQAWIDARKG
ncbi:Rrf2 family transcriptional regulator [Salmonella enterica subsp. enterica]|uniref:Transcriptional regulator n=1 Tax=Salmonella enterica subsp. enterica serovar Macclesfield str. S-1643 TaxID=1242107 RepID=A0A2C9NUJ2_SALET|nr:Rrf2 family transcriptional regulator [Salmonella enterica]EAA5486352.1 Rrf2 family transcriptional regulator [Salmonella enterica subsp. enterica serovar Kouka]EBG2394105.1 Rrf2 family transcriptional regulator [Salmonella enterica subsp. enterica serovar Everleigh]EBS1107155.1 Rrf2 family transcriptional regulator [Salmonella enterica subsp. enterica serovar Eingedi]EBV2191974.1 Rrf2 family transcriptional regulator [Salmonella enterica subsp. enterica serovar Afula]ECH9257842.1 Rrf2 fami